MKNEYIINCISFNHFPSLELKGGGTQKRSNNIFTSAWHFFSRSNSETKKPPEPEIDYSDYLEGEDLLVPTVPPPSSQKPPATDPNTTKDDLLLPQPTINTNAVREDFSGRTVNDNTSDCVGEAQFPVQKSNDGIFILGIGDDSSSPTVIDTTSRYPKDAKTDRNSHGDVVNWLKK